MREYKKIILNNGIPLYLNNDPSCKQAIVNYVIKYGSNGDWYKFELDGKHYNVRPGVAHLLEHLLGERSKYGDIYSRITNKNSNANAYTDGSHTSFWFQGSKEIKESVKELIECIDDPVFDEEDIRLTKKAIEREISSYTDDYRELCDHLVLRNLYGDFELFPKSLSSIGRKIDNKNITIDEVKACYDAFYTDDRKVLAITGSFDEKELVDYLNEIYSNLKTHKSRLILPEYDYSLTRKEKDYITRNIDYDLSGLGIKIKKPVDMTDKEFLYTISFITSLLFNSDSNFNEYLRSEGYVDRIKSYHFDRLKEYGNYALTCVSSKPDEYFKRILDKINSNDMIKGEFDLIKRTLLSEEVRGYDSKYDNTKYFGYKMSYTEDYDDIKGYREFDYDRFKSNVDRLDFSTISKAKVKRK